MEWTSLKDVLQKATVLLMVATTIYAVNAIQGYSEMKRAMDSISSEMREVRQELRDLNLMKSNIENLRSMALDHESRIRSNERTLFRGDRYGRSEDREH